MSAAVRGQQVNLVPSVDSSFCLGMLPFLLSLIAGATDVISFLGLDGLFTAHITGNLSIRAEHIVSGGPAPLGPVLSVPIFIIALSSACLLAPVIEAIGSPPYVRYCCCSFSSFWAFLPSALPQARREARSTPTRQSRLSLACSASRRCPYKTRWSTSLSREPRPRP